MNTYLQRFRMDGKVAVITGGGRNIGLACGQALAEAGASVVITDIDPQLAKEGCQSLRDAGFKAESITMDVTDSARVEAAADEIEKRHGHVDVLVCSAGVLIRSVAAEDVPDDLWLKVIDINLNGVFRCCRTFGKRMLARGKGSIVNIGSMSGFIVNKQTPSCYYNAAKAGVHHLTKCLASEWGARGVRVNAVAPTYIETSMTKPMMEDPNLGLLQQWVDMIPMGRVGQPDEIASAVLFLASDAASLITGDIVLVDGGYTCW